MADRVLEQWLQRKRRYVARQGCIVDVGVDLQAITEAELLERQVVLRERPFLGQQHLVAGLLLYSQGVAHEVAELLQRLLSGAGVAAHQGEQRVQRVEEEVRIDLGA